MTPNKFFWMVINSLILSFFCAPPIFSFYYDDFLGNTLDESVWEISPNSGTVSQDGGSLNLKRSNLKTNTFPYIRTIGEIFPNNDPFSFEIRYRFTDAGNFGDGITITSNKFPLNGVNPDTNLNDYMTFMIYQDKPNGISYGKILCDVNGNNCNSRTFIRPFTFLPDSNWHIVKIVYTNKGEYEIYIDDLSIPEFVSSENQPRPKGIWAGNSMSTSSYDFWNSIEIDYIKIDKLSKDPIVVLPGFGGSWDLDAILTNSTGTNWKVPDFIKEYDGIIKSLKNAGYEENKDLFVFAYDWRKPLDSLADDLNAFLISKSINTKNTSLVGHSMGGLVARSYLQKYNNPNIQKVITAGSPHKGILDAYGMWEGLTIWDGVWWQKALHLVATEVNRSSGETELQAARRVSPSVKDLLPTWDFLQKDGQTIPISQMTWKNDYLLDKNSGILNFTQRIFSGFSSDYQSKNKLLVTKPAKEDNLKGLWQDGKPIKSNPFLFALGDGYVTNASSGEMFDRKISLSGNHGEVISKKENVVKILEELGVATGSAVGSDSDTRKRLMVFKLNSPGTLEVCQSSICGTNLGLVFVDKKMIMIPGFVEGKFDIKVKSFGELGNYQLQIGEINETAEWSESYGKLTDTNQVDSYNYNTVNNQTVADQVTNSRNITLYFPQGIDLKNINKIRQDLLKQMDVNIGLKNTQSFDLLIEKWIALDNYVSGLDPKKIKGMNHRDWGEHDNSFVRSKFATKFPNYFTERLVEIYTDLDVSSDRYHYGDNFYKLDKKMQAAMLKAFLRL